MNDDQSPLHQIDDHAAAGLSVVQLAGELDLAGAGAVIAAIAQARAAGAQTIAIDLRDLTLIHGPQHGREPDTARTPAGVLAGQSACPGGSTDETLERCQGRSVDEHRHRVRPCSRRPMVRVTGTHRLAADLCTLHARVAIDRPRLVREWLLQEGAERASAGLAASAPRPLAGGRPPPWAGADTILRVAAELASVTGIRAALSQSLKCHGWAEELHPRVLLAVGEAVANAVEHGSSAGGAVEVGFTVGPGSATVHVIDEGRPGASFPLGPPASPPPTQPRGRGRLLMRRLAERVEAHSDGHGTRVLLHFTRPARMGSDCAPATRTPTADGESRLRFR